MIDLQLGRMFSGFCLRVIALSVARYFIPACLPFASQDEYTCMWSENWGEVIPIKWNPKESASAFTRWVRDLVLPDKFFLIEVRNGFKGLYR